MTRLLSIAWLAVVWILLWGSFTLLTVVGGVLVGWAVTALFATAPVTRLPVRPLALASLVGYLARDLVVSSLDVAVQTVRYGRDARGAILEVPLLTASDRVAALVAAAYGLSPGTLVLQVDLDGGRWFIYVLGPRDVAAAERGRRRALEVQCRVLAAIGAPAEAARARAVLEVDS